MIAEILEDYRGAAVGDEGLEGGGKCRVLRNGVQLLEVYQARERGSTELLDEIGHCGVEEKKTEGISYVAYRGQTTFVLRVQAKRDGDNDGRIDGRDLPEGAGTGINVVGQHIHRKGGQADGDQRRRQMFVADVRGGC